MTTKKILEAISKAQMVGGGIFYVHTVCLNLNNEITLLSGYFWYSDFDKNRIPVFWDEKGRCVQINYPGIGPYKGHFRSHDLVFKETVQNTKPINNG